MEPFPFLLLDGETTIFDVCRDGSQFKVINSKSSQPTYVRSTYKTCTEHEFVGEGTSLRYVCIPESITELPIPTRHEVYFVHLFGMAKDSLFKDREYLDHLGEHLGRFETLPHLFLKKVAPFAHDSFSYAGKKTYRVPLCE